MSRTPFTTEKVLWHLLREGKLPPASSKRSVTPYEDYYHRDAKVELPFEEGSVVKVVIELANPGKNPTTELSAWKCSWIDREPDFWGGLRIRAKWDNITENLV